MVLAIEMGVVFVLLTAILMALYVVDNANMLTAGEQLDIENMLLDINRQTGIEYFG